MSHLEQERRQKRLKKNKAVRKRIRSRIKKREQARGNPLDEFDKLPRQFQVADLQESQRHAAEEARQKGANALEQVVDFWLLGMKGLRRKYGVDPETKEIVDMGVVEAPEWMPIKCANELANRCGLPPLKEVRAQFEMSRAPVQVYAFPDPFAGVTEGDAKKILEAEFDEETDEEDDDFVGGSTSGNPPQEVDDN